MGWEREDGAALGQGSSNRVSSIRLISPNLPFLIPSAQKAEVWVFLRKEQCYCSYFVQMFFCLSKPALACIRDIRDICKRQRHLSMQEVCFVTDDLLVHQGWGGRNGAAAKALQSQSCGGTFSSSVPEKKTNNKGWYFCPL